MTTQMSSLLRGEPTNIFKGPSVSVGEDTITSSIVSQMNDLDMAGFASEADRVQAKNAALALAARLETPFETGWRHAWQVGFVWTALKILDDISLFKKWGQEDIDRPMSVQELAAMTTAEPLLIERLLRHLSAEHLLEQTSPSTFKTTHFTREFAGQLLPTLVRHLYEINIPMFTQLPPFVKGIGFQNPKDGSTSALTQYYGKPFFEWLAGEPGAAQNFSSLMNWLAAGTPPWTEIFPVEKLVDEHKGGRAMLVDIGGNAGHDIQKLLVRYPDVPDGSLVLQDRPEIVSLENAQALRPKVLPMIHDFFTPQPVKGARAYYLHHILHDWDDSSVLKILKHTASAMEPGYSSLLIHEVANPTMHPGGLATSLDICMMAAFSALERTDSMWEQILAEAGLKVAKVWRRSTSDEQIIEAVLT